MRWVIVGGFLVGAALDAGVAASPSVAAETAVHRVSAAPVAAAYELRLRLDEGSTKPGADVLRATNAGRAKVQVTVRTRNRGRLLRTRGRHGGYAVRLPRYAPTTAPAGAVLLVKAVRSGALDPGYQRFRFGTDFVLNRPSSGSEADNGDNLVQRGLWGDSSQYKIQVDHRVPECRVKGSAGSVLVKADVKVATGKWYRLTCRREGGRVTLILGTWDQRGAFAVRRWSGHGPIGRVALGARNPYMSIGGKVTSTGDFVKYSTDQFNGIVDNVFYDRF